MSGCFCQDCVIMRVSLRHCFSGQFPDKLGLIPRDSVSSDHYPEHP